MAPSKVYLRRKEAAAYVTNVSGANCAPATLAKLAVTGGGPLFRKIGRCPIYDTDDLDDWIESRISPPLRSTSDL
jgi:hypothetical protein